MWRTGFTNESIQHDKVIKARLAPCKRDKIEPAIDGIENSHLLLSWQGEQVKGVLKALHQFGHEGVIERVRRIVGAVVVGAFRPSRVCGFQPQFAFRA